VRIENVRDPQDYIRGMLDRVRTEYVKKAYNVRDWTSPEDFLEQVARRFGKLLKVSDTSFPGQFNSIEFNSVQSNVIILSEIR
jgi:nuclear GTP-binding protein